MNDQHESKSDVKRRAELTRSESLPDTTGVVAVAIARRFRQPRPFTQHYDDAAIFIAADRKALAEAGHSVQPIDNAAKAAALDELRETLDARWYRTEIAMYRQAWSEALALIPHLIAKHRERLATEGAS